MSKSNLSVNSQTILTNQKSINGVNESGNNDAVFWTSHILQNWRKVKICDKLDICLHIYGLKISIFSDFLYWSYKSFGLEIQIISK